MSVPDAKLPRAGRSRAWPWLVGVGLAALVVAGAVWAATRQHTTNADPNFPPPSVPASPLASPSTTAFAVPGQVTVDPSLPSARPLPAGIWSETGPGWVLATYSPAIITYGADANGPTAERTRQVVYLVSPAGTRYQVLELDPNDQVRISSWSAGEDFAYVEKCGTDAVCQTQTGPTYALDLTSGATKPADGPQKADYVGLTLPNSTRLWFESSGDAWPYTGMGTLDRGGDFVEFGTGWTNPRTSPNGAWVSFDHWIPATNGGSSSTAVMATSGNAVQVSGQPGQGLSCEPYEWTDANLVLEWCTGDPSGDRWFTVNPKTLKVAEVPSPLPALGQVSVRHDLFLAPGVWAGLYGTEGALMWTDADGTVGIDDHGTLTKLSLLDAAGATLKTVWPGTAVNGVAYFVGHQADVDQGSPETVVAYDVATGRQTVLIPSPPAGLAAEYGVSDNGRAEGVTSWVVAP